MAQEKFQINGHAYALKFDASDVSTTGFYYKKCKMTFVLCVASVRFSCCLRGIYVYLTKFSGNITNL